MSTASSGLLMSLSAAAEALFGGLTVIFSGPFLGRGEAFGRIRPRCASWDARYHVQPEGRDSTLLDEVDLLAGVSGGAFPAAHFGLYGKASFETFPEEFLYPDNRGLHLGDLPVALELGLAGQSAGRHERPDDPGL